MRADRHPAAVLLNTTLVEAWPGGLLRARGNHDARLLAGAERVLRRKDDGRYLAVVADGTLRPLRPGFATAPGLDEAMRRIANFRGRRRPGIEAVPTLPLQRLCERLDRLGIDGGLRRAHRPGAGARTRVAGPGRLRPFRSE